MSFLLLSEDELRQLVTFAEAVEATEKAFIAASQIEESQADNFSLYMPEVHGQADVNGTYIHNAPYFAIQLQSTFQDNPSINLASQTGLVLVFDAATGFLAAIMIDNGYLARIRSAAVGAIAAKYLANPELQRVAIIGVGNDSYLHLKALLAVKEVELVEVWATSPLDADNYARRMIDDHDLNIQIASTAQSAAHNADLIIAAARSRHPVIEASWLKPGVHITCISHPGQQKIEAAVLQRAAVIVTDNLAHALQFGQMWHAIEAKALDASYLQGELGSLLAGHISGRSAPDQITLADLTGLSTLDAAIAAIILEKAIFLGLGQRIEAGLSQWRMGQG